MQDDLVISAKRVNGPDTFVIEIDSAKVEGLLKEFGGDFGFLAQFLRLQDKRMVLINPKYQPAQAEPPAVVQTQNDVSEVPEDEQ